MSIAACEPVHQHRPSRLKPILDWLRHARVALSIPQHRQLDELSDQDLADLGGGKPDIARIVDRETRQIGLIDLGWRQPGRRS